MRIRLVRAVLVLAVIGNVIVWHRIWRLFVTQGDPGTTRTTAGASSEPQKFHRRVARLITVVIRQFETFENDVASTVHSVLKYFPLVPVLIVGDELPYPPLELDFSNQTLRNVKLLSLQPEFNKSYDQRDPLFYIRTKYVLFLPDSTRLSSKQVMQEALASVGKVGIVSIPVGKIPLNCLSVSLRVKEWSLRFVDIGGTDCDAVSGKHATLLESKILRKLSDPFMMPFADALYIQTTAMGEKLRVTRGRLEEGKALHQSQQSQWKVEQLREQRERRMLKRLGIKKVTRASGSVEWYGCSRESARCFGSVVNGVPSYLYQRRHTPPCCLAGLRRVAQHVFERLEEAGLRFWLEGRSLLGAMRSGDILPWDHEVQVGVNRDDLRRSPWLARAERRPVLDDQGFLWERATEGHFFRVHYSKVNRLHVNLLPFYAANGSMARDAWFLDNADFPEQFLHPMSSIEFAGRQVPCPNNIRDFLEHKYFKGVVENPAPLVAKLSLP